MTKHVRVWITVYKMLPVLARKMAAERGKESLTLSDAASQAILEALAIRNILTSEIEKNLRKDNYESLIREYEVELKV